MNIQESVQPLFRAWSALKTEIDEKKGKNGINLTREDVAMIENTLNYMRSDLTSMINANLATLAKEAVNRPRKVVNPQPFKPKLVEE